MPVFVRQRDRQPTPIVEAPAKDVDNRIDAVLRKLDSMANQPQPKIDLDEAEGLASEIAALRVSREMPWEFKVKRDKSGSIKEVTATQVRPRLI